MTVLPHELLRRLFEEDFLWEINDNPEFGYQSGFHDYLLTCSNILQDVSPEAYENRSKHSAEMVLKAQEFANTYSMHLYEDEIRQLNIFENQHKDIIDSIQNAKLYLMPINSIGPGAGGAHYQFIDSIDWMRFEIKEDFEIFASRIHAFPIQIDQFITAFKEGIKQNIIASQAMIRNVESQLTTLIESNFEVIVNPITNVNVDLLSEELKERIMNGISVIREGLIKLRDFFVSEYFLHVLEKPGCKELPNGDLIYQYCLKYHTTTDLTADEIHTIGLAEVKRIEDRFKNEVLIPLGFDPDDFKAFSEHIKGSTELYVKSSEELLNVYKDIVANKIQPIIPKYFNEIPQSTLEILGLSGGPAAFYITGTNDGKRPGRFYVNISRVEEKPVFETIALTLHEAIPGHHHQGTKCEFNCFVLIIEQFTVGSINSENNNLPKFLRYIEDRRYDICPCRRSMCTAYLEGWGLYSEYLGEEMGLYVTPYYLFGRLTLEMMRAVRLVVDTGIHSKGWSTDEAIAYMLSKTAMHYNEVAAEIYRYASMPGQACAYKIGEIQFRNLRKKAEEQLGDKFDVRNFHSACLNNGPMSMLLLEKCIDDFIAKTATV